MFLALKLPNNIYLKTSSLNKLSLNYVIKPPTTVNSIIKQTNQHICLYIYSNYKAQIYSTKENIKCGSVA